VLQAFTAGLLLITVSELGDKTFFIAVILAIKYSRKLVFGGVMAALTAMTVISVLVGQVVSLLPRSYIHYVAIILFVGFGLKLLYEASQMPNKSDRSEAQATAALLDRSQNRTAIGVLIEAFVLTFLAEWGDRTQIATITLAASNNSLGVTAGAILGHGICTAIAVVGGRLIAGRISERTVTAIGGCLFLIFAAVSLFEGV
jgi:Ca2+/H+ antiporter, TMEM165/GDT1 family